MVDGVNKGGESNKAKAVATGNNVKKPHRSGRAVSSKTYIAPKHSPLILMGKEKEKANQSNVTRVRNTNGGKNPQLTKGGELHAGGKKSLKGMYCNSLNTKTMWVRC